jgi:hypothetical protein
MAATKLRVIKSEGTALADEIVEKIESGRPDVMLDVTVTVEIAKLLLRYNAPGLGGTNRLLRPERVAFWATIMRDGDWVNTGEPIIFSDDQTLNDGQHRLTAVVVSEVPTPFDIRFGIPRRAFLATNVGAKRTASDALLIEGYTNQVQLSGLARLLVCFHRGLPTAAKHHIKPAEIVSFTERNPDILSIAGEATGYGKRLRMASFLALRVLAKRTANEATVDGFFEILRNGGSGSTAAHQLHDAIWSGRGFGSDSDARVLSLATGIQAWNAYRKNERVRAWWMPGQPYPKVDGLGL